VTRDMSGHCGVEFSEWEFCTYSAVSPCVVSQLNDVYQYQSTDPLIGSAGYSSACPSLSSSKHLSLSYQVSPSSCRVSLYSIGLQVDGNPSGSIPGKYVVVHTFCNIRLNLSSYQWDYRKTTPLIHRQGKRLLVLH